MGAPHWRVNHFPAAICLMAIRCFISSALVS